MELTDVLRGGRQCDEDGVEIIMSREACHVAADEIERLRTENKRPKELTLTVAEIYDLACAAGFTINHSAMFMPDADEMETEITIIDCPAGGVLDDDGKATHYEHVAYLTEYPEEGTFPLGAELAHNAIELTGAASPRPSETE